MIELGGNITLDGFSGRDYSELIVVKKIVGRYARQISDQHSQFESLKVALGHGKPGSHAIDAECTIGSSTTTNTASAQNLFVALDAALKGLMKKV